jgi:hypothetical protein
MRIFRTTFLLTLLLGFATAVFAQETADTAEATEDSQAEESRWIGKIYAEISAWVSQPVGLQFVPALQVGALDPFDIQPLELDHGTENRNRFVIGMHLDDNVGDLSIVWYSNEDTQSTTFSTPSDFQFVQQLTPALMAGVSDDGRADAFTAENDAKLRDLRVLFSRTGYESDRLKVRWSAGLHKVGVHSKESATYFALAPLDFPALLPPVTSLRPDLEPQNDTARINSDYSGRGAEFGVELTFPVLKKRLEIEAGMSVGILRGELETIYTGTTSYYGLFTSPGGAGDFVRVIEAPFDDFFDLQDPTDPNSPPLIDLVTQVALPIGIKSSLSTPSMSLETSFGFRWHAWGGLDVIGGFRSIRYDDAAYRVRPVDARLSSKGGVGSFTQQTEARAVGYEGLYLGIAYLYGR